MLSIQIRYRPGDLTYAKIITLRLEISTHWANMHIPVDIMSNIRPAEFIVCYNTE